MAPEIDIATQLIIGWVAVSHSMVTLPVYNPALQVQATAFHRCGPWHVGVVVTPWFMNVVAVHDEPATLPHPGASVTVRLPAGDIDATVGELAGFGRFAAASLFSPMQGFSDPVATMAVAESALRTLFTPDTPARPAAIDRRAVLRGGMTRTRDPHAALG